ncbi:MAG: FG-GAP-like repeat-containing protein [Terriglobales bacterium]
MALVTLFSVAAAAQGKLRLKSGSGYSLATGSKFVPGQLLVKFRDSNETEHRSIHQKVQGKVLRHFKGVHNLDLVQLPAGSNVQTLSRIYRSEPTVEYAEPNYVVSHLSVADDPLFPVQWDLKNIGQKSGTPGADIRATQAWSITQGDSSVVVAVIDTGVDYTHPDLVQNIWSNPGDCDSNGVDDDGDGYIDDCHGIDTFNHDSDPFDDEAHGTHVSGTIGATGNNGVGVAGINWAVKIVSCKFIGSQGYGDIAGAVACLDYVKKLKESGVNIVATNNSWGGNLFSQALADAVKAQMDDGILFVAAAGNDFSDNDLIPTFPANLDFPNVITVAATNRFDEIVSFSNFGLHTVHVSAPGEEIVSTTPANTYSIYSGTSMAAPHVTGVAALLKAQDPSRTWWQIKNLILSGGKPLDSLSNTRSSRRLDAYGSLTCTGSTVRGRLKPILPAITGAVGTAIPIKYLSTDCALPNAVGDVIVAETGEHVVLADDGNGSDAAAGDGVFSAAWVPPAVGTYTLQFPDGDSVQVSVLNKYWYAPAPYEHVDFAGTNLDLDDDSVAGLDTPFPIHFGDGSFSKLYVSSNGTLSLTNPFVEYSNSNIPLPQYLNEHLDVVTVVAPFWDDLFPVKGGAQNVYWGVVGSAPSRRLIVEWRDVRAFDCRTEPASTVNFQIVFQENSSNIRVNYPDVIFGGGCADHDYGSNATMGIQIGQNAGTYFGTGFQGGQFVNIQSSILWSTTAPPNPIPTITSITPTHLPQGSPDFDMTVIGTNFIPGSQLSFLGSQILSTYVSPTQINAHVHIPWWVPGDFWIPVKVVNPGPGGGESNQVNFVVDYPVGPPGVSITSLSPSSIAAGGFSFELTITGTGFGATTYVRWNNTYLESWVFGNQILAEVPANLIATPGTASITVISQYPQQTSNALTFTITAPAGGTTSPQLVAQSKGPGTLSAADDKKLPERGHARRFLGWGVVDRFGPEYTKRFSRPKYSSAAKLAVNGANPGVASVSSAAATPPLATFQQRVLAQQDYLPTSAVTGDFNGDGAMDYAVSNGGANSVWIYFGDSHGNFGTPRIEPLTGQSPIWLLAVDTRKIGILDLIVAEADSGTVGVLLGNGNGTFQPERSYYVPAAPLHLVTADFNADGTLDIAVGLAGFKETGPIVLLPGRGDGTFGNPIFQPTPFNVAYPTAYWLSVGDVNGDGRPDLLVTDITPVYYVSGAVIYLNQGDGTFKPATYVLKDFSPNSAELADVDNDGCLDAVVNDFSVTEIYKGHCDSTFEPYQNANIVQTGDIPVGTLLKDVNADGKLDLITSGVFVDDARWYGEVAGDLLTVQLGDGTGDFGPPRVFPGGQSSWSVATADFNGDGVPDFVTANEDTDTSTVFLSKGPVDYGNPQGGYNGYLASGHRSGFINASIFGRVDPIDVDGDGLRDLVFLEYADKPVGPYQATVALNQGNGKFSDVVRSPVIDGLEAYGDYTFADMRNTGRPDFLAIGVQFETGTGNGIIYPHSYFVFAPNTGGGHFGKPVVTHPANAMGLMAVGDLNGDGKLDVVSCGLTPSQGIALTSYMGDGSGGFSNGTAQYFNPAGGHWPESVYVDDVNGDGKLDVLVWTYLNVVPFSGHAVYEFLGNGDGSFRPPVIAVENIEQFQVADLNHDGYPDLIEAVSSIASYPDYGKSKFRVYLGHSDGSFSLTSTYSPYDGVAIIPASGGFGNQQKNAAWLGDFNGDGNLDIAAFQGGYWAHPGIYAQIMLGKGDGSFIPTYGMLDFHQSPPTITADMDNDGKSDLVESDVFSSTFNVDMAVAGRNLALSFITDPVTSNQGIGRVELSLPSQGGATVSLSTTAAGVTLPPSVNVTGGSITQEFSIQIDPGLFDPKRAIDVTAHLGSESVTAYVTKAQPGRGAALWVGLSDTYTTIVKDKPNQGTKQIVVTAYSGNGYATRASFRCEGLPHGASCTFNQPTVDVPANGTASTSLLVVFADPLPLGRYQFNVVVDDGVVSGHSILTIDTVNPVATITSVSPSSVPVNSADLPITVTGNDFVPGSEVLFYWASLTTTYVDAHTLQAIIPANFLTVPAARFISVRNPWPGGGDSPGFAFTIINPNTLTITSPNGGEVFNGGTSQTIRWTYTGNPGPVNIALWKEGFTYRTITWSVPLGSNGSGSYVWTVPTDLPLAEDYKISVYSGDGYTEDESNHNFRVNKTGIKITDPKSGAFWRPGTTHTLRWIYSGSVGSAVKIDLYNNGVFQRTLSSSTSIGANGVGTFNWTLPQDSVLALGYHLKVTSTTNSAWTDTSEQFNITNDNITLTSPNGGELWRPGHIQTITWTFTGDPGCCLWIYLEHNGTQVASLGGFVGMGSNGTGQYTFVMPDVGVSGDGFKVHLQSVYQPYFEDWSDAPFVVGDLNKITVSQTGVGGGAGTITSTPAGLSCAAASCSAYFDTSVHQLSLQAVPGNDAGGPQSFTGWGGDCSSYGTSPLCSVDMDGSDKHVSAAFAGNDFSLSSESGQQIITTGKTAHFSVTLTAGNHFSAAVALSCAAPLPTGITGCNFAPSSTVNVGSTPVTVDLAVSSATSIPVGVKNISVTATGGGKSHTLPVSLIVEDFTQTVTPASMNVVSGSSATYTVKYTPLGGMNQPINVGCGALPAGVTCTPDPPSVTPGTTPGNQSIVTVATTFATTPGANATVAIMGNSLGITRSTNVTLSVKNFTVSANTAAISTNVGSNITDTIVVKGVNGFTGNVALACLIVSAPTGTACNLSASNPAATATGTSVTATITSTAASTPPGSYTVQVTGTTASGSKMAQFTVNIKDFKLLTGTSVITIPQPPPGQSSSVTVPVTLTALNSYNSSTALTCTGQPAGITCAFSPPSGIPTVGGLHSTLTVTSTGTVLRNTYHLQVKAAAGTLIRLQGLDVSDFGPNFTQSIVPTTQSIAAGTSGAYLVTFAPLGGMTQDIAVSCGALPAGVTCTPNPMIVIPGVTPLNQSLVTLQTSFGTTPAANSIVAISGNSSAIGVTRSTNVTMRVKDFSVTASSAKVMTNVGTSINDTILIKGLNGFTGNIPLTCAIVGEPAGMGCTLSNVNPAATSTGTNVFATITSSAASTPAGSYSVQVTGTTGAGSHTAQFTVEIKDFALEVAPSSQSIGNTGGTLNYTGTLTALNGFVTSVTLSCVNPQPPGITCAFGPSNTASINLTPTALGSNTNVRITVGNAVAPGTYFLTLRGISGVIGRTQHFSVNVMPRVNLGVPDGI